MSVSSELHVVFGGTGAVGAAVVRELVRQGRHVRVVNRSGHAVIATGVEVMQGDATNADSARRAAAGAAVLYHCVGAPPPEWITLLPRVMDTLIAAAGDATLVYADNLYMYPPTTAPMTEDLPDAPITRKGRLRARLAEGVLAAHRQGRVRATIGRASDFYGPGVRVSTIGDIFFGRLVAGKPVQWLGPTDQPHSITYIDDFARGLVTLATHDEALGQVWHVPTAAPLTGKQYAALAAQEAGLPARVTRVSPLVLRLAGVFSPAIREEIEMQYQFMQPYILDDTKFIGAFGGAPTPYPEVFHQTITWFRAHSDASPVAPVH
jgi:nucleoside-diphosphate-sugar epimerase